MIFPTAATAAPASVLYSALRSPIERRFLSIKGEYTVTGKPGIAKSGATRARILVVEDEKPIRELLRLHLENEGYEVVEAADAFVAGKMLLAKAWRIDLLIVDAHMPYMTGIDFAAAVLADTTLPVVPIILITGHKDLVARADVLGVPCLLKPFTADALAAAVGKTLAEALPAADAALREREMARLRA